MLWDGQSVTNTIIHGKCYNTKKGSGYFNVPQKKYAVANHGGMKNKDKIRLSSVAQYGLTIFWKEVNIQKK